MCEEFKSRVTPIVNKIKNGSDNISWYNVTGSNLIENNLDKLFVRLDVVWHILIDTKQQRSGISAGLSQLIAHHPPENPPIWLLSEFHSNLNQFLAIVECLGTDRLKAMDKLLDFNGNLNIMNKLLELDSTELERHDNTRQDFEDIDEVLLWFIHEYIRLSSLPSLSDTDTERMMAILELAQIDTELNDWINRIDTALAQELEAGTNVSENCFTQEFILNSEIKWNNLSDMIN